jgi:hypothetical protein
VTRALALRLASAALALALACKPEVASQPAKPESRASEPSPPNDPGLARYAQRTAELHLGSPDGPVIGSLAAGAPVSVATRDAEWVRITIPGFAQPLTQPAVPVVAFVRADALGAEASSLAPSPAPLPAGRVVRDYPADIALAPTVTSDEAFAATLCGDIRVLEQQPPRALIAQSHAGVELRGWVDAPVDLRRGPIRCTLRQVYRQDDRLISIDGTTAADRSVVAAVPSGYVGLDPMRREHLLGVLRDGTPLHWLVAGERGSTCQRWTPGTLQPDREPGVYRAELSGPPLASAAELGVPSFSLRYRAATPQVPGELVLFGPHFERAKDKNTGGYRSGTVYTIVGATPDAVRAFPSSLSDSVVAWHPDDEERWFFSEASCRAAARAAEPALQAHERTPPGGFHVNPFPELDG